MAIEIKTKEKINWFPFVMAGIFIVFFGVATYFLFFNKPPLVEYAKPTIDPTTAEVVEIKIDPTVITENPVFQSLALVPIDLDQPNDPGRANPFMPFPTSTIRLPGATSTVVIAVPDSFSLYVPNPTPAAPKNPAAKP